MGDYVSKLHKPKSKSQLYADSVAALAERLKKLEAPESAKKLLMLDNSATIDEMMCVYASIFAKEFSSGAQKSLITNACTSLKKDSIATVGDLKRVIKDHGKPEYDLNKTPLYWRRFPRGGASLVYMLTHIITTFKL